MKNAAGGEEIRFKPLWRIRNKTYRQYVKGYTVKRFKRYVDKLKRIMHIKH